MDLVKLVQKPLIDQHPKELLCTSENGSPIKSLNFDKSNRDESLILEASTDEGDLDADWTLKYETDDDEVVETSQESDKSNGDESLILKASTDEGDLDADLTLKYETDDDEVVESSQESDKSNGDESLILEASTYQDDSDADWTLKYETDDVDDEVISEISEVDEKPFVEELKMTSNDRQPSINDKNNGESEDPEKSGKDNKSGEVSKSGSETGKVSNEHDADKSGEVTVKLDAKPGKKCDSDQKTSSTKSAGKDDKESHTSKSSKTKASLSGSPSLRVSGLSSLTRATDLKIIFSKYGEVICAKVVVDTRKPSTMCYGLVTMNSTSEASECIKHLHRSDLHSRIISVERTKTDGDKKVDSSVHKKPKKEATKTDGGTSADAQKKGMTAYISREQSDASSAFRRPMQHRPRPGEARDVLSFLKIPHVRERQCLRERERNEREENRRRVEASRHQPNEDRLAYERERLMKEILYLEREKAYVSRLKLELKQLKIEEAKRAIKRPPEYDRYAEPDRKRSTSDCRIDPPPPRRFDTNISSRSTAYENRSSDKKHIDDYSTLKRDEYRRNPFKRPVDYAKWGIGIETTRHTSSSSFDARTVPLHRNETVSSSSAKDRNAMTPSQSSFSSRVRNERESRKSRYFEISSADSRYPDKRTYNERKSQLTSSQYIDTTRQSSFTDRPR